MKVLHAASLFLATGLCLFAAREVVTAGSRLVAEPRSIPGPGKSTVGRSLRGILVRNAVSNDTLDLGRLHRTLVLLFAPACGPCDANVVNWMDFLATIDRDSVGVVALGMGDRTSHLAYWSPFGNRIPVLVGDSAMMFAAGFRGTPTTLLVDKGIVVSEYIGILNPRAQSELSGMIVRASQAKK